MQRANSFTGETAVKIHIIAMAVCYKFTSVAAVLAQGAEISLIHANFVRHIQPDDDGLQLAAEDAIGRKRMLAMFASATGETLPRC